MIQATGIQSAAWLLVALPAITAAILLLAGKRADKWGHLLGTAVPIVLFVITLALFFSVKSQTSREVNLHLFSWISVGSFNVDVGFLIDPLSLTFALLITGVGSLIHIYAVGYMDHDPGRRRFFGYFNLFIAAMLLLVLANGYLVLYVGWEGVGVASYLLIGYYYNRSSAATAAKKAFIANRVGDVGLSIAIMLMFAYLGSTSFAGVFGALAGGHPGVSGTAITAIGLMLLLGACGKSGQFPLQTWLPDAMEGPTPVSALIHAATMVTAGVYLICRSAPIFDLSETARTVVTIVGAITLLYGCICAFGQDDLKKVLAYSTVSQIGYMFLAAGLGNGVYAIAIMHLLGHGFFKAALFLSAGAVMHAMNDRIDMRRFGGLRTVMPVTFVVFVCGYLAIIGFPFATGYFTKDKIIEAAFDKGGTSGWILGIVALLGAGLTAFYMTRALIMTFFGEKRWEDDVHPHEAPKSMTVPMLILAFFSLVAGGLMVYGGAVQNWLTPSVGPSVEEGVHTISPIVLTIITLLVVAGGAAGAYVVFGQREVPATAPVGVTPITTAARNNLYADAFNEAVLMRPGQWLTRALVFVDNKGIDGGVNGLAAALGGGSARLRRTQNGFVRSYALSMLLGTLIVVAVLLGVRFL
ncbi:NADH dehydrogenase subunit L [Jatrophihabitans sp. GAS493]|uniref:NADH-quinone oxidoreductase subunit L n=1 Tax=Jatrophihabitans sp. GAS493 TaxID=1907575 RepID=UPI000BBF573B|nr:NADH-quinone oxidoreductase subunit L [Jatrophihabitans sp. GAS493]SOD72329.1 NADH dehydrogenase subunit L [Jatrophihabitans sp. GAS493]